MTTLAAIDRVVHHSVILDLMALESYRAKEATITKQQATTTVQNEVSRTVPNEQENSSVTSGNGVQ